jgi:transposase
MSLKLLIKTKRSFLNQLHSLNQLEETNKVALKACKTVLKSIEKQINRLDNQMQLLAEEHCRDLFVLLQTIPGISKKSALELIIVSGAFKKFTSDK